MPTELHVGFTGSRNGMTIPQIQRVTALMEWYDWLHHGDCIGADAQAHDVAEALVIKVAIHPPTNSKYRAWCYGDKTYEKLDYLDRNREIVKASIKLIAGVDNEQGTKLKSGTWATIRYGVEAKIPVAIVRPSGRVEDGNKLYGSEL